MQRVLSVAIICLLLTGCFGADGEIRRGMDLRERLLSMEKCTFDGQVTADYGDSTYSLSVECSADKQGNVAFKVTDPDIISGITGEVSGEGGKLTFDDKALCFPLLADDLPAPVTVPWLVIKTLRSGYITSAADEGEFLRLSIDDGYSDDALHTDIWLSKDNLPVRADILWDGRRILSMDVVNFNIQ